MKTIRFLLVIFVISVGFTGCQEEEDSVDSITNTNLSNTTPVTNLLARVTQNPTFIDNVLDNSSYMSIVLPVTLTVNGQQITVNSQNDYQLVQNAIDAYSNDDDVVHFSFPISIKQKNYQIIVVNNQSDYNSVLSQYPTDDGFNEIACIGITFPITLSIYDSNNQFANSLTVTNNTSLYNFISSLQDNVYYSINYPIEIHDVNGVKITITSNHELEELIEDSVNDCTSTTSSDFSTIITSGTWHIDYCYYNEHDDSNDYTSYNFTFLSNGTINVVKNSTNSTGTWYKYTDSGKEKIDLTFSASGLNDLQEDWKITEYTPTSFRLRHGSSDSGGADYLYFDKN